MMQFVRPLLAAAVVGLVVNSTVSALTEREAVVRALARSADIQIIRLDRASDSLTTEITKAGWLPGVGLSAGVGMSAANKDVFPDFGKGTVTTSLAATATQVVPGGGKVSGSVTQSSADTMPSGPRRATDLGLSYTQPLVKGAWAYATQDYAVRIRRLDQQLFSLAEQQKVLGLLSTIRKLYWDAHAGNARLGIQIAEVDYAQRRLATERQRLMVGSGTSLDTLSALLELLKAQQGQLDAEIGFTSSRRNLAVALNTTPDSLDIDTAGAMQIGEIPPPDAFIEEAQKFDPQLRIFETLYAKYRADVAKARNQMLPQVDFSARYGRTISGPDLFSDDVASSSSAVSLIASYALPVRSLRLAKQQKELSAASNQVSADAYRKDLLAKIQTFSEQWEQDKRRLEIAVMTEDVARRNMQAYQAKYDLGSVDNLTLLKARNDYTSAALGRIQTEIELKKIEIDVQEITGASLSEFGVTWE